MVVAAAAAAAGRPGRRSVTTVTQKWEYKVVETAEREALQPELTSAGVDGWELVSATAMFNTWMSKVVYVLFLKRPAS
jgi:hypothetical protein